MLSLNNSNNRNPYLLHFVSSDVVSNPKISFAVLKESSHNYSVMVTCQSTKGTPPITFSLNNSIELVASRTVEDIHAAFKFPLVLGQRSGRFRCHANNGDKTAYSDWIPIEVGVYRAKRRQIYNFFVRVSFFTVQLCLTVPVGGPVTMNYHYDAGEDHVVNSLTFYCKAAKGSIPRYQWFLNNAPLHDRGTFYYVVDQPPEQSMLLLSVERSSAGTYHCEVSDSFDNTTAISSRRQYIDRKGAVCLVLLIQSNVQMTAGFMFLTSASPSSVEPSPPVGSSCCVWMFRLPGFPGRRLLFDWSVHQWVCCVPTCSESPVCVVSDVNGYLSRGFNWKLCVA